LKKKRKKTKTDEKNTEKNENSVFADDDLLISRIFIFLPLGLTLRNEDVNLHYPRYCHCCCVLYSKIVVTVPALVEIIIVLNVVLVK